MRTRGIIGSAALLASLVAGGASAPPPTRAPDGASATAERDGVRVTLTLEGRPTTAALSWVRVHVANVGAVPVRWWTDGCKLPARVTLDLAAALAAGHDWPGLLGRFKTLALKPGPQAPMTAWYLEEKIYARSLREDAVFCQDSLPILELAPGESLDMRAAWDGKLNAGPAPAGPAVVEASFPFIGLKGEVADDDTDVEPISVRLDTSVVGQGGRPQLSPAVAIDAALEDPEFAAFVEAAPEDTWMGPDVTLIEGNWAVTLFRYRRGDQTVVLGETAIVDQTGRVVGHRSD